MTDSTVCQICNNAEDNWRHAMIECNMAKCVWSLVDEELVEHLIRIRSLDARIWLMELMDSLKDDEFIKVLVTLWAIWWARREGIHEQEFRSPLSTFSFVQSYLADLAMVPNRQQPMQASPSSTQGQGPARGTCKTPMQGCMKLNVDAVVGRHGDGGSCVFVCRDQNGVYIGASASVLRDMVQPEILEAITVWEAFALASDLHLAHIHIASDCATLVNNLKAAKTESAQNLNSLCAVQLFQDIKKVMIEFEEAPILHENREHIWEASDLARFSVTIDVGRHLWLLNPPKIIEIEIPKFYVYSTFCLG